MYFNIGIYFCCSNLFLHMSNSWESPQVRQWSGGNPGFLEPSGRTLILAWIHTQSVALRC